jgi:hypothetical protein
MIYSSSWKMVWILPNLLHNPFSNLELLLFKGVSFGVAVIPARYGGMKRDRIKAKNV